jgi:hypothetical protein
MKFIVLFTILIGLLSSCRKIKEYNYNPEIEPLKLGFQTSAAIGYCANIAHTFFTGGNLPGNVILNFSNDDDISKSCILFITVNNEYPLPFNSSVGQITIAGLWNGRGGVITALFTDIDIIDSKYELKGIHTIPFIELGNGNLLAFFAQEDIVIGGGEDTIVNLQIGLANMNIAVETDRLDNEEQLTDVFAAVDQNVWFITIDKNNSASDVYDDNYTVCGGGQIAEVTSLSGGLLYHAMIDARFTPDECLLNPTSGVGFIQNLKVGTKTDLGFIFLNFNERCDGKAYVELATGKYLTSNHKNINLNFTE